MVDEDSLNEYTDNSKYIGINEFSKAEVNNAIEYIKNSSQGMYIVDTYKESMKTQQAFTATPEQFENPYYDLETTIGLGDQSFTFIPVTKVGQTFYTTGKEVTPYVVRQTGQVYDDVTLGMINYSNKVLLI